MLGNFFWRKTNFSEERPFARVGVPVKYVYFQVALLARRDVRAVGTVPSTESLHHNHVCESILKQEKLEQLPSWV